MDQRFRVKATFLPDPLLNAEYCPFNMAQSDPVDLSHHLSDVAKSIKPNPLKVLYKYRDIPGLVKLAGKLLTEPCFS